MPADNTSKYRFKRKPYKHQVKALKRLIKSGWGGALLMEPRTGKTKVVVDYASILFQRGRIQRALIVGPVSVAGVWTTQIAENCPHNFRVFIWDKRARKKWLLPESQPGVLDFVFVNYDGFSTPGAQMKRQLKNPITGKITVEVKRSRSRGGKYTLKKELKSWVGGQLMVLDESHRIKSPTAAKSRVIHSLGRFAKYRVIMTGTVVTKKKRVIDIYSQWAFLNPARFPMTFTEFKAHFSLWITKHGYDQWIKNRNENELHRLIHLDSYAVTRDECYDLPDRLDPEIILVPLEGSAQAYDDMAEDMIAKIHTGQVTEASIKLVQRVRLQQITSGLAKTTDGDLVRIGHEKIDMFADRCADLWESGEKIVAAARFREDIVAMVEVARKKKIPVYELHGGIKPGRDRDWQIAKFQKEDDAALFVMQPSAGSLGIDLSTASTFVWYSLTDSYVDFTQAEDRIALSGKANRYIYLLGEGTNDEHQYEGLLEDADVSKRYIQNPELLRRQRS